MFSVSETEFLRYIRACVYKYNTCHHWSMYSLVRIIQDKDKQGIYDYFSYDHYIVLLFLKIKFTWRKLWSPPRSITTQYFRLQFGDNIALTSDVRKNGVFFNYMKYLNIWKYSVFPNNYMYTYSCIYEIEYCIITPHDANWN